MAIQPSNRQAAMPFIMVTVLIDMIAIGLIIPVLPALVGTFTGGKADQAFWYGAVTFAFSIANFIGSPILGALSDKYGRRPVLLLGFSAFAMSFFFTALATDLWMLIVVRLFSGAMQSNQSVANAYVADISAPEERAKRFGLLGAMFGLGFILGPALGGVLGDINLHLPFFAAGSMALLNLAYGYFVLPESLPAEKRLPLRWQALNPFAALRDLSQLKGVGPLVAVLTCSGLAQFVLYTSWVLYASFKFGWGPAQNGASLFVVGISSVLVQGVFLGPLLKRYSPQRLAVVGLISSTLAYLAYGLACEGWMIYAIILLNMLGFTVQASINSLISNAADASIQGKTMGAVSGLSSLTAVVAPLIATPLLSFMSDLPKDNLLSGAPFYFCALVQGAGLVTALWHFRAQRLQNLQSASSSHGAS